MARRQQQPFDARWLLEHEARRYDAFGERETVGSMLRWRSPDNRRFRDGNHVAIPAGQIASAAELVRILDRQVDDGATRCVDVYGPPGANDQLCLAAGLSPEEPHVVLLMAWRDRCWSGRLRNRRHPVEHVSRAEWVAVQVGLHVDGLESWGRTAAAVEAQIPNTAFYAARVRNRRLSALLRHDWDDVSQIETVYTHAVYREHGLASSCLARALEESTHGDVFLTVWENNVDAVRLYAGAGAEVVARDLVRRYVG